jgi:hypothetical protein
MWVARDEDGELVLHNFYPERGVQGWWESDGDDLEIVSNLFPSLKWDDEPIEVEIVKKEKA